MTRLPPSAGASPGASSVGHGAGGGRRLPAVAKGQTRSQEEYLAMQQEATVANQQLALKAVKVHPLRNSLHAAGSWLVMQPAGSCEGAATGCPLVLVRLLVFVHSGQLHQGLGQAL